MTPVETRRTQASQQLDVVWPVERGVAISRDRARRAMFELVNDPNRANDYAAFDAMLLDCVSGWLLVQLPEDQFARPETDEMPPAAEATKPSIPMFHPADGSEPVPFDQWQAREAERRERAAAVRPVAVDLPDWAELHQAGTAWELRLDLSKLGQPVQQITVTLGDHVRELEIQSNED